MVGRVGSLSGRVPEVWAGRWRSVYHIVSGAAESGSGSADAIGRASGPCDGQGRKFERKVGRCMYYIVMDMVVGDACNV